MTALAEASVPIFVGSVGGGAKRLHLRSFMSGHWPKLAKVGGGGGVGDGGGSGAWVAGGQG